MSREIRKVIVATAKIDYDQYRWEVCEKCDKRSTYSFMPGRCSATTTDIYLCAKAKEVAHERLDTV